MVEYALNYNNIFQALADETRRGILLQLIDGEKTISEIATSYAMSFAAVAKHLQVLESARLVIKRKHGRMQIVSVNTQTIASTTDYLQRYAVLWDQKFNKLEALLKEAK